MLTFRQLRDYLNGISSEFLDSTAMVCDDDGQFRPVEEILESDNDLIMDDGHPYLQII